MRIKATSHGLIPFPNEKQHRTQQAGTWPNQAEPNGSAAFGVSVWHAVVITNNPTPGPSVAPGSGFLLPFLGHREAAVKVKVFESWLVSLWLFLADAM